jgi:succinate--hydroxymethylglutarate CoA-transferase
MLKLPIRIRTSLQRNYCSQAKPSTTKLEGALKGVRILDLSRVLAGPYCTMILGDMGAEVLKIEQPNVGDETRDWGPPYITANDGSKDRLSAYFIAINRNKRSVTVDFKKEEGRELISRLAKECDVLVENFVPGKLDSMGLSYETLSALNPRLIYLSITGYGATGPHSHRPGYDVIIEAEAGLMFATGEKDGPPVKVGVAVIDLQTGLYAHGAILAALYARDRSGKGQKIDVSLLETQCASMVNLSSNYLIAGKEARRIGTEHANIVPYQLFKTKPDEANSPSATQDEVSGIVLGCGNNKQWEILCRLLDKSEWIDDAEMRTNELRTKHRDRVISLVQAELARETSHYWMDKFRDSGLPSGPLHNLRQTFEHPQVLHRNMVVEVEHEKFGAFKMVGIPVKYSLNEPKIERVPPLLGQDTDEVLSRVLGLSQCQIDELRRNHVV